MKTKKAKPAENPKPAININNINNINSTTRDELAMAYAEYLRAGESGKATTNALFQALTEVLLGTGRAERIRDVEARRQIIRETYAIFNDNFGTGKSYFNNLIQALVNYALENDMPRPQAENEESVDELPEIFKIPEPATAPAAKTYQPPLLVIKDPDEYRQRARIAAGLVFYDDISVIGRCLESLRDFDLVICMDGRYDIADGLPLSTDGSREVVKSFDNTLLVDMPFRQQTDLRNHYLYEATWNDCDYLLVIEADEYVTGDMDQFRKNLPVTDGINARHVVYNVPMSYVGQNHTVKSPRFFFRPHLIRYGGTHSTYVVNGYTFLARNGNESETFQTLADITVNHDEKPRTKEQESRAQKYQRRLVVQEREERVALKKAGRVL